MRTRRLAAAAALAASIAALTVPRAAAAQGGGDAAQAPRWVSWLCNYTSAGYGGKRSLLVRVDDAEQRVQIDGRDVGGVQLSPDAIRFAGPGGDWLITRPGGSMLAAEGPYISSGTCRRVND